MFTPSGFRLTRISALRLLQSREQISLLEVRGVPLDLRGRVGALTHGAVHFALGAMQGGRRLPVGRRQPLEPRILYLLHIRIGLVFLDPLFSRVLSSDRDAHLRLSVHRG
ncbi:hypothetical protein EYF80_033562 [Liparis tanakae]|uniref:Uncharacterized protein n=1 Tax=Liparis tanakae TaxID=230148 RepID=A0A4Z2GRT2_9TELE|nr:hypothetical protein EYF80_033562 [Liparis tanakae]